MNTSARVLAAHTTPGVFNYLDATVRPSLFRNGEVLTRRDPDGSDGGMQGVNLEARELTVNDARALAGGARRTMVQNGLELLERPLLDDGLDFFDHR